MALLAVHIALSAQQLGQQDRAAGSTPEGVVAQAHEFIVVLGVRTQAAQRDGHAALQLTVQLGLGTVWLLEVMDKLLGRGGKLQLLGSALEIGPV